MVEQSTSEDITCVAVNAEDRSRMWESMLIGCLVISMLILGFIPIFLIGEVLILIDSLDLIAKFVVMLNLLIPVVTAL